ncbi:hypothetical protein GCM10020220_085660 [Nonomuraea rubra]|uniref:aspartate aminotransferase family protein n=1 Tax=Nonomuraea rubra TaxID=46180 RepID=UPI0031E9FCCE
MEPRWSSSKALWERACRSIGGGVASSVRGGVYPHQLYFESGKGAHLVDIDGDRYIDYVLGWGPLLLGHGHPAILEAAHAQLDRGIMFGGGNMHEVVAAERFLGALGWAERLLWTNTGTEAVQIALRLARAHTGRDIVVKLGGGYHGWHDTVLASYMGYGKGGEPVPHSLGQPASSLADLRVGLYNDLDNCASAFEAEPGRIAAVLVDPTSSNTGSVAPEPGYLEGLRRLCDEHGALLIFDEVVSGLRLGLSGAAGRFGVTPDLATYGKAIGSGMAVAAVAGRGEVIDLVLQGAVHSGTFNGNPLAMTVLTATLDVLSQPGCTTISTRWGRPWSRGCAWRRSRPGTWWPRTISGPRRWSLRECPGSPVRMTTPRPTGSTGASTSSRPCSSTASICCREGGCSCPPSTPWRMWTRRRKRSPTSSTRCRRLGSRGTATADLLGRAAARGFSRNREPLP